MNTTVIVSVYKDVEALGLIIDSLLNQTSEVDEIIISEDGNSDEMREYYTTISNPKIRHLSQEDRGWQKNRALNRAINNSKSEYLIFIDGDCIPYPSFVESHLKLSKKDCVLCGRRTEPGERFSSLLRDKKLSVDEFVSKYFLNYFKLAKDKIRHYDDGIFFDADSKILKFINRYKRKNNHIVGCNFSCFKSDLQKINGFDEDFTLPTTGEDSDIERRMRYFGIKMNSCRNSAIIIHLYHEKIFNPEITSKMEALMESKKDVFICKNGLKKS